jgi:hypothetical protein
MLFTHKNYAQLQFLNIETEEPISNVKVFNRNGNILGISNIKGNIKSKVYEIKKSDSLSIFHSDFTVENLTYKELVDREKIFLKPTQIKNLEQVLITGKKPRYLKITGYFLSYQLIDNLAQSFSDGIIEYYIDLKRNKIKTYNIKDSRLFKNKKWIKELEKKKSNVISLLGSNILHFNFSEEILLNEWEDRSKKFKDILNKNEVGAFHSDTTSSVLTIEYYTPQNPRRISFLGLETVVDHYLIREKFISKTPDIEKLESVSKYYSSKLKKKDQEIDYQLEQDFYVIDFNYLNKEQYKLETEQLNQILETNFSTNYWEENFGLIPPNIENKLYNNMEPVKK